MKVNAPAEGLQTVCSKMTRRLELRFGESSRVIFQPCGARKAPRGWNRARGSLLVHNLQHHLRATVQVDVAARGVHYRSRRSIAGSGREIESLQVEHAAAARR